MVFLYREKQTDLLQGIREGARLGNKIASAQPLAFICHLMNIKILACHEDNGDSGKRFVRAQLFGYGISIRIA